MFGRLFGVILATLFERRPVAGNVAEIPDAQNSLQSLISELLTRLAPSHSPDEEMSSTKLVSRTAEVEQCEEAGFAREECELKELKLPLSPNPRSGSEEVSDATIELIRHSTSFFEPRGAFAY
jgi:hypothetical protein